MTMTKWTAATVLTVALTIPLAVPAAAQTAATPFVPFDRFVAGLAAAGPAALTAAPSSRVADPAEAARMHAHLMSLYGGVTVRHSYALDGQVFDCLPVRRQPSLRGAGPVAIEPPPAEGIGDRHPVAPVDVVVDQGIPFGADDGHGNRIGCAAGEIPMRRLTPANLARFGTLANFFRKGPGTAGRPHGAPLAAHVHKYAHAYQNVANIGGTSYVGLWKPHVDTAADEVFSLSQHWYTNYKGTTLQTAEVGWQNYPNLYGVNRPVLFIYWTADDYNKTGCYNLDCKAFVQTDASVHLGAGFKNYSTYGGTQYSVKLTYLLQKGKWWLGVGVAPGTSDGIRWVGYYPATIYGTGKMATGARDIDYGGETDGSVEWPPMGSGHFAAEGGGKAAYQRRIRWFSASGGSWVSHDANLTASEPSPTCYTIDVHNAAAQPAFRSHFYFGGPGGGGC